MTTLTTDALAAIRSLLHQEQELVRTTRAMAQQCEGRALHHLFLRCADKHQQHYNALLACLPECPEAEDVSDSTILETALREQRQLCSGCGSFLGRCTTPELASVFEEIMTEEQRMLRDLELQLRQSRPGYPEPADCQSIQQVRQLFFTGC